ncbi:MAG: hypothetical protein VYE64_01235 [Planctomycetota bacterium]|nr:hypothetical protein [Planctomycetota bacterium]
MSQQVGSSLQPHRGTLVLILGILAICCNICGVPGILAWIFGAADLKQMQAGTMDREGEGLTKAGWIMGMVGTGLWVIGFIGYIALVFLGALAGAIQ